MQQMQRRAPASGTQDRHRWSDFMDLLQEAGLGQNEGVSWLVDHFTPEREVTR